MDLLCVPADLADVAEALIPFRMTTARPLTCGAAKTKTELISGTL